MNRSVFEDLAIRTETARGSTVGRRPTSTSLARPQFRFTADQLDRLRRILSPGAAETPADRSPQWEEMDDASDDREARYLRAVDRAIAEMAGRLGRRRRWA
jgi:hypothetical protein